MKHRIIKVTNNRIYLNESDFIPIEWTNIPKKHLIFIEHKEIFWKVEVTNYEKTKNALFLNVIDYKNDEIELFKKQSLKGKIDFIYFEKFQWENQLEPLLSFYQFSELSPYISNEPMVFSKNKTQKNAMIDFKKIESIESSNQIHFVKKIDKCIFRMGYVSCSYFYPKINQTIEINIPNSSILPEFDAIKFWFAKVLKTNNIRINATVKMRDNQVIKCVAHSKEVESINESIIDTVKRTRTLTLSKKVRAIEIDKSLFTAEDVFEINSNDKIGNIFKQDELSIIDILISQGEIRNKKEIIYLSTVAQSTQSKIKFTNHPFFGFIFLIEGERNRHFVWELLNTHATYIWSFEKATESIEIQFDRIENIINAIIEMGREQYKTAYKKRIIDEDIQFNVIKHKDKNSQFVDEFPKWKYNLNQLFT